MSDNLLSVGDIVQVKGNSFYNGMSPENKYVVFLIWNKDGRDVYSFKKVGKSGKGIGKSFSHLAIKIDNSIDSRIIKKVN
jgi:hypothetical protein